MNKKIILTSLVALTVSLPSFADIAANNANASCDTGTLNTSSGTSNLRAGWSANTINVQWYDGDSTVATNTCTYDGGLTIPNVDSKTGYTFGGWRVRATTSIKYTACDQIEDEITCEQYSEQGCSWFKYKSVEYCFASCYEVSEESWCADGDGCKWCNGACQLEQEPC